MYWNLKELMRKIICQKGLTLTWDVLKYYVKPDNASGDIRLTLTWDVLKLNNEFQVMRKMSRLTLTWDVLK